MNLAKLMKQAQRMQEDMARVQGEVAQLEATFSVGGGVVQVTARGDNTIKQIKISPTLLNPAEAEAVEDMVLTAVNGALEEIRKQTTERMGAVTGGMQIPGMM